MTPREALYYICIELGPIPVTERDDHLTPSQMRIRESVRVLQDYITEKEETLNDQT